jgi:hypothetical protein
MQQNSNPKTTHCIDDMIIDYFNPKKKNKVVTALITSAVANDGSPVGFSLMPSGDIAHVEGPSPFETPEESHWQFQAPFILKLLAKNDDLPVLFIAARFIWTFGPRVSQDEADAWEAPIEEHPDAMPCCEMIGLSHTKKAHWLIELTSQGILRPVVIKKVYVLAENNEIDPRFSAENRLDPDVAATIGIKIDNNATTKMDGVIPFRKKQR